MWETLFVRRVQLAPGRVPHCEVEFRGADRTVMAASCSCLLSWLTLTQSYCDLRGSDRGVASLLFHPPEPQHIGKTRVARLFYLFAHLHLLSSDSFSSLIFFRLTFSSLTLSTSAFQSVHIVGGLISIHPSTKQYWKVLKGQSSTVKYFVQTL